MGRHADRHGPGYVRKAGDGAVFGSEPILPAGGRSGRSQHIGIGSVVALFIEIIAAENEVERIIEQRRLELQLLAELADIRFPRV